MPQRKQVEYSLCWVHKGLSWACRFHVVPLAFVCTVSGGIRAKPTCFLNEKYNPHTNHHPIIGWRFVFSDLYSLNDMASDIHENM